MRGVAVLIFSLALVSGADASSIVVLGAQKTADPSIVRLGDAGKTTPSIMTVGATEPGTTASPSLVVLGAPAVNAETVAAIPTDRRQRRAGAVLVIRAGVVGGSSAAPVAVAASAPTPAVKPAGAADGADDGGKAPTLRDAMTSAGRAPALPQ